MCPWAQSGITVAAGYREGAIEALPTAVLEHVASAGLHRLQEALENLDLYFYREGKR